ncbi:Uncharacterized methyltransferase ycgJ [Actinomyces bovis]|uniref:Uncharacterized methyltransferase ycgJ n=1 Tax=Actinomyces bovis TaxID=1658 RepID=A0ABY1VQ00_9ACTO|nr:methyltransferase domain-containing protein [Actinomyces bovis]SPT54080.1 Uncharacterized methyltransferase ycgJ [Actinomyces bovis]VEG53718.1 Uncharacterized methyltransferase ycgJ [Actinomyces israelii]
MTIAMSSTAGLEQPRLSQARKLTLPSFRMGRGRMQRWALDLAQIAQSDRVLNMGCQSGGLVRQIMHLTSGQVAAVDCSLDATELVRTLNRAAVESGRLRVSVGTSGMLPFRSSDFDVVTALNAVSHWPNLGTGLREIRRVLRKGGRLVIVNEYASQAEAERWRQTPKYHVPDADEIIAICQRIGFRRVTAERHESKGWLGVVASD